MELLASVIRARGRRKHLDEKNRVKKRHAVVFPLKWRAGHSQIRISVEPGRRDSNTLVSVDGLARLALKVISQRSRHAHHNTIVVRVRLP